jgi:heat shock protein HtpX
MAVLAAAVCLAVPALAQRQTPVAVVQVHLETTGEATIQSFPRKAEVDSAFAEVLLCQSAMKRKSDQFDDFHCAKAMRRDGLALEAAIDPAPIARQFAATDVIQLWINYPRLGFESTSSPMKDMGGWIRAGEMIEFAAGNPPPPIQVKIGYRRDQIAGIYLPLAGLAVLLVAIAAALSRAGLASLNLSVFVLGATLWMGLASRLQAGELLRIALFGSAWGNIAGVSIVFLPPLVCVAAGVALGSERRDGRGPVALFSEVFWGYGTFLLPLICAIGALPAMVEQDWLSGAPWLLALPFVFIAARLGMRAGAGGSVRQVSAGELREQVSAMAARIGRPRTRLYILFSTRAQYANAFALPGRSIFFTAPLVRTFSKGEVLAVAAHELSHFNHRNGRSWAALFVAMVLFQTPLFGMVPPGMGWLFAALLLPFAIYFATLAGARRREFAADAGAAALTGDPRAMISALARIIRTNKRQLEMSAVVEWFSSHPSTHKRIGALAALGGLQPAELVALCTRDDPGEPFTLPEQESGALFTPAWQTANGGIYSWVVLFASCVSGLTLGWVANRFAGGGFAQLLIAIVLGCAITKGVAATVMAWNYARLGRRLAAKLGVSGQLVGLAPEGEPRLYKGFRFSDAGLLWFEGGRLCYRSESASIALNPADVVDADTVAASPSNWLRLQPRLRFRCPESGEVKAVILHPVDWLPTQRRLLRSIEQWRATQSSAEATSVTGLNAVAGQPFRNPAVALVARAFLVSGGATLAGALLAVWLLRADWRYVGFALAIAACVHVFMFLPSMLYRPPAAASEIAASASAQ